MNETFTSVLLFHTALKTFLIETVGLTIDRTLGDHDVILTNGAGTFLRLQKKTNGDVVSVGMELGGNADLLEVSTFDTELWFPFDTSSGGIFQGTGIWIPDPGRAKIIVSAGGENWSKRYHASLTLSPIDGYLIHQDHLNPTLEQNFKERGGPYIRSGV